MILPQILFASLGLAMIFCGSLLVVSNSFYNWWQAYVWKVQRNTDPWYVWPNNRRYIDGIGAVVLGSAVFYNALALLSQ